MTAAILAWLLAIVPPGRVPERETYEQGLARYASIAEDIAATTHSRRTAALLVAIAVHESALRVDVDDGRTRGDGGRALGLWQLQGVDPNLTRAEQAAVALTRVRRSFAACASNDLRYRLAAYASGRCDRGWPESAAIIDLRDRLIR